MRSLVVCSMGYQHADIPVALVGGQGDAGGREIGEEPHGGGLGALGRGGEVTMVIVGYLRKCVHVYI